MQDQFFSRPIMRIHNPKYANMDCVLAPSLSNTCIVHLICYIRFHAKNKDLVSFKVIKKLSKMLIIR
ncbi:hypothetical protein EUGRSUZ_I01170 [Eucalyptus grandis]|uniref:Uncharacterized protein n=2 Tax=Eucalyptus grandis TaxID=71139 RepID=A0ACC3JEA2_EUCGR|nr:hypothetical protein EUGRSUZ_I01170 [Eucalyptus grandis]